MNLASARGRYTRDGTKDIVVIVVIAGDCETVRGSRERPHSREVLTDRAELRISRRFPPFRDNESLWGFERRVKLFPVASAVARSLRTSSGTDAT